MLRSSTISQDRPKVSLLSFIVETYYFFIVESNYLPFICLIKLLSTIISVVPKLAALQFLLLVNTWKCTVSNFMKITDIEFFFCELVCRFTDICWFGVSDERLPGCVCVCKCRPNELFVNLCDVFLGVSVFCVCQCS